MIILANDGIDNQGKAALESAGFQVITEKVEQEKLAAVINEKQVVGLLVRSATKVRKDLIDACPGLRFVGRGGVGIDNIDADYAREKGIHVFNTPASSSQAVAELVMALIFAAARGVYDAGKYMGHQGHSHFEELKKKYSKGFELRGKTLGIIGFGRIGQSLASYALGCGMKVIATDQFPVKNTVTMHIEGFGPLDVQVPMVSFERLIQEADIVSLHVPKQKDGSAVLGDRELAMMKKGALIVNTSRGGVVDESALQQYIQSKHIAAACLDVFVGEPTPQQNLLQLDGVVCTPHIGASTLEAQERIGLEIAQKVREIMGINV